MEAWVYLPLLAVAAALGVVWSMRRTSRLEKRLAGLQREKRALEAAKEARGRFIADMSHEFRTPLHGVLGMTEVCLETDLTDDQRHYLTVVQASANSLLSLVNDILDFSKVDAGQLSLNPEPFEIRPFVRDTVATFEALAQRKGLELNLDVDAAVPSSVIGDHGRLRQTLVNLLGNAIRFTVEGHVSLRIHVDSQPTDGVVLRFEVSDTGVGIPRDKQQAIFQEFAQADSSTASKHGGTGLGLAISSALVQLMNGQIGVESEPGKGSTFHFTAHFALQDGEETAAEADPAAAANRVSFASFAPGSGADGSSRQAERKLNILVAEDDPFSQELAVCLLSRWGHQVSIAANGKAALEALERRSFDLVVMDVHMPEVNGLEVIKTFRQREQARDRRTPIIALTASALDEEREECFQAGADGYLSKPMTVGNFFECIEKLTREARPSLEIEGSPEPEVEPCRWPELPINPAKIRASLGDRCGDILPRLVEVYLKVYPQQIQSLREAIRTGDSESARRVAHSMKGNVGQFGADQAQAVAREIEEHSHEGRLEAALELLPRLEKEIERIADFFRQPVWLDAILERCAAAPEPLLGVR